MYVVGGGEGGFDSPVIGIVIIVMVVIIGLYVAGHYLFRNRK